ncbi:conserved oligomeric Golgi complex subunit 1-like, partial [Oncorhynchus keta]|uniref:conserved oligomeric Golgi complex subunit 1-like n=1 Tax=Oncorhynchus keta TaxID=8018 RepID=UPI00227BB95D
MAVVPAQSLRVSDIRDPTVLFERYNTEEIRGIERNVRGEIEHKKEELRQMVGERYRDLIDAADTIGEMRQCSESVVTSIQDMHRYCHKLKQGKSVPQSNSKEEVQRQSQEKFYTMASQSLCSRGSPRRSSTPWPLKSITVQRQSQEKFYTMASQINHCVREVPVPGGWPLCTSHQVQRSRGSPRRSSTMASQIKLLLEIPEEDLEFHGGLSATRLYLLCCHLHRQLHLEAGGPQYSPVLARFPILVRQVAAAGHFRSTILLDSKSVLRGRAVSDQAIAEALVSTMLLEDSSPRQALADFLLARKASIQQLLNQPQHGAGIKAQVCSLVELLVTTLYQAYAVFYVAPEGSPRLGDGGLSFGLLFTTLENVTSTTPTGKGRRVLQEEMSTGSWFKYLPSSIAEFQPALRTLAQPIQREQLRDTLQQWINT